MTVQYYLHEMICARGVKKWAVQYFYTELFWTHEDIHKYVNTKHYIFAGKTDTLMSIKFDITQTEFGIVAQKMFHTRNTSGRVTTHEEYQ